MPIYWFESKCGDLIEVELPMSSDVRRIKRNGKFYNRIIAPISFVIPEHFKAASYAGSDGAKRHERQIRHNKKAAKKLASGEATPGDNGVFGPEMPREYRDHFNQEYQKAKNG